VILVVLLASLAAACGGSGSECGPTSGHVARVIDGDTIELATGEKIRYLMVDTPESTTELECYGENAKQFNTDLVADKDIELRYDVECEDRFGRTLAYVTVGGVEVNTLLVERGFGCVLHIPPNGDDRADEFDALEDAAKAAMKGLWGACSPSPC
jgi:micrococcal nuclease